MKKKRIAQLCCAALVVAGVGLNIQNALTDYGMNKNSLSLVAGGEYRGDFPYYTGITSGWCSFVNETCVSTSESNPEPEITLPSHTPSSNNTNSNYPNTTLVTKIGRIEECGPKAGFWKMFFEAFPDGHEEYITGIKKTYMRWHCEMGQGYKPNPDGTSTLKYYVAKYCKEYYGADDSNCPYNGAYAKVWVD